MGFRVLLGLLSCSILCINYSAFPPPLPPSCGSGGVSVGWIGLSEAEVRPALLIIGRTKYSPAAWLAWTPKGIKLPGGQENRRKEINAECDEKWKGGEKEIRSRERGKVDRQVMQI